MTTTKQEQYKMLDSDFGFGGGDSDLDFGFDAGGSASSSDDEEYTNETISVVNICNAWKHGQYSWFPNELRED